ncbi:mitogen-activated protein kinase 16 [Carica papaya]|uniref:mitogen-activated protein kinase 16 n=1 Tax=Carica papaya TaxID=3649 RepID=UPI000B8D06D9|nr:mitogen-activated protein kinase 16 [Carica papaya]
MQPDQRRKSTVDVDFFTEYGEGSRYRIEEVIGKGSYGVVCSAYDTHTGEKVAIKKINDIFEHVSDATRILREIKLLRLLHHPDIVEIKHILLPPSRRNTRAGAQILSSLVLLSISCPLTFLLSTIVTFFLSFLFFSFQYTPAIDIWSIGCIFAELLTGKPLFPGKNVVHQLDLMTDLLGTPSPEAIARVRNEKARRYLSSMRKKKAIPFSQKFPNADPLALRLLEKMLAFEPKDRPTAEEALADPYFKGLAKVEREPSAQPVTKMEFEFERRRITKEDVREFIYREILEYHPKMLKEYLEGSEPTSFMYPSAVDHFKKQFAYLEEHYGNGVAVPPPERQHASLPRPCVLYSDNSVQNSVEVADDLSKCSIKETEKSHMERSCGIPMTRLPLQVPQSIQGAARPGKVVSSVLRYNNCGAAAAAEALEQRRIARHPSGSTQYNGAGFSYPRRNPPCKNERGDNEGAEGPNGLQSKSQYVVRKVAAAQGGSGSHWY